MAPLGCFAPCEGIHCRDHFWGRISPLLAVWLAGSPCPPAVATVASPNEIPSGGRYHALMYFYQVMLIFISFRKNKLEVKCRVRCIENKYPPGNFVAKEKTQVYTSFDTSKSMWVFGYGSLIWKADFPYKTKLVGYIKGYKRRFYQHSVDHRGRPNKPGRVVTLIPSHEEDKVWGVAYEIYKRDENFVTAHLDYREKTGYEKHQVLFYPTKIVHLGHSEGDRVNEIENLQYSSTCKLEPFNLVIYIGTEDNKWFAGPASIEEIAKQISESEGPSGTNKEYLFNLAKSMRAMAPYVNDEHLFSLENAVLDLEKANETYCSSSGK